MRKLLLFMLLSCAFQTAQAQPASGIAPNFNLRDLNGTWHNLYSYLDQGKTVFIEFSAAWCSPCWNFHNGHAFRDLYQQHGPAGYPGVHANTTNDVMVIFIEGEPDNSTAQLYGIAGAGWAQSTQGDWVTGTPFPILDTNAATTNSILNDWNVTSFPTMFMVCRDRLVSKLPQLNTATYYNGALFNCPSYPPSSTVDAKALPYNEKNYFFCTPDPVVRFQNYSASATITNATINIFSNNTQVNSYNWTGNLPPYGVADVQVPPFAANPYSGYRYEVNVTGDSHTPNNKSADSLFWVYSPGNAAALPHFQDFDFGPLMPWKYRASGFDVQPVSGTVNTTPVINVKGINGQNTRAIRFHNRLMWWYETADLIMGNHNTTGNGGVMLEFDVAYAQYNGTENDTLEVLISTDCGNNWLTAWLKSGDDLKTTAPVGNFTDFYPQAANQWRHESVDLSAYKDDNTLIIFRTHCNMGNDIWIDNLKLDYTTSIDETLLAGSLDIYPNPATDELTIMFKTEIAEAGSLMVADLLGRPHLLQQIKSGSPKKMDVSGLAAGIYNVIIIVGEETISRQFSVVR